MKKIIFFVYLTTFVFQSVAQWEQIHPKSQFYSTFTGAFVEPVSGKYFAIGSDMAVSSDSGKSWQKIADFATPVQLATTSYSTDLVLLNAQTVVLSYNNRIYKTSTSGSVWEKQVDLSPNNPNHSNSSYFTSMFFTDSETGFAVGGFKKLFKTTNGGSKWDTLSWSPQTTPYISYTDILFLNDNLGFISGYEVDDIWMNFGFTHFVLKTNDGGKTWSRSIIPAQLSYKRIYLQAISKDTIFATLSTGQYKDVSFKSTDGGLNWVENSPTLRIIKKIKWIDGKTAVAFGEDDFYRNKLLRTDDAGVTWQEVYVPFNLNLDANSITDFAFSGGKNGFATGAGGMIIVTEDAGKTWTVKNPFFPSFISIDFPSAEVGYVTSGMGFYKTINGGHSWEYQNESDSLTILKIQFSDNENGYFYGFRNYNYRVEEGGMKIKPISTPEIFVYSSNWITQGDSVYIAGATLVPYKLSFLRSADRGESWETWTVETGNNSVSGFHYAGGGKFYLSTSSQQFKLSNNGGATWTNVHSFMPEYMSGTCMVSEDTLLALIENYKVLRTTDGGNSWNEVLVLNSGAALTDFYRVDNKLVYVFGATMQNEIAIPVIWKSEDGGQTWNSELLPQGLKGSIVAMSLGDNILYATLGYGQILRKELKPDIIASLSDQKSPVKIKLYPVPAGALLHCRMPDNISVSEVFVIKLNGEKVTVPYSKIGQVIVLNISDLSAGMHFLQVITGEGVISQGFIRE